MKRKFLTSVAVSIAALLSMASDSERALVSDASAINQPNPKNTAFRIDQVKDNRILHDFVLERNDNNELIAGHRSHYSHRSHQSHRSHYSGY